MIPLSGHQDDESLLCRVRSLQLVQDIITISIFYSGPRTFSTRIRLSLGPDRSGHLVNPRAKSYTSKANGLITSTRGSLLAIDRLRSLNDYAVILLIGSYRLLLPWVADLLDII